jgi:hypothetical protein
MKRRPRILRVFPRRTRATPFDELTAFGPPGLFADESEFDEVHVSVTFSWDLEYAKQLFDAWDFFAPGRVRIGGPAFNERSEEFVGGLYIANGYTITSRGCPRKCWFCRVPKVEGGIRELDIVPGWNVLDDNILATSDDHFLRVCEMLGRQRRQAEFTGGLDAELLTDFHINLLSNIKPRPVCFFAFDPGDEFCALKSAADRMLSAGWTTASGRPAHSLRCYVLIGHPRDTPEEAEARLEQMLSIGFTPMAMLWKNETTGLPKSDRWYGL